MRHRRAARVVLSFRGFVKISLLLPITTVPPVPGIALCNGKRCFLQVL